MRNECNIIRDILPLYIEDMVSADTADFVEAHLEKCDACRAELENMKNPSRLEDACQNDSSTLEESDLSLKHVMKKWNHKPQFLYRTISILMMLIALIAFVGIITVTGSGFLDLSNIARIFLSGIAIACVVISTLTWKTNKPYARKTKVIFLILVILVIVVTSFAVGSYDVPATEIIN